MRFSHFIFGAILSVVSVLLMYFAPDSASMVFIGIMIGLIVFGYILGIIRVHEFTAGFRFAQFKMKNLSSISTDENWIYVKTLDSFFRSRLLDKIFKNYFKEVQITMMDDTSYITDIESMINEEVIEVKCFKSLVDIIPGTLTGLGILGTFYGLIQGLGGIRFSSVDVVIESISILVRGIDTAFFTSIAGVLLSILFEMMLKTEWNMMLDQMDAFLDQFHLLIIPSVEKQKEKEELLFYKKMLEVKHESKE